jgi:hypothetical protein
MLIEGIQMKLGNLSKMAFAGAVGLFASQSMEAQNLLANPGFEAGNFSGWTLSGSTAFEGVSSTFATAPYTGSYSAFFGAVGGYNIISQTINTVAGDTYNLSFAMDNSGGAYSEAFVNWGSAQVWDIQPTGTFGWNQFGLVLTATGSSTTVSFGFEQVPSYFNLDNTSLVDLTANPSVNPITTTTVGGGIISNADPVPDQAVGIWATAATLLGLCALAGYRRHQQAA